MAQLHPSGTFSQAHSACLRVLFALLLPALLGACALGVNQTDAPVVMDCELPQDQQGTLTGHWKTTPVPIALHQGDFDPQDTSAIVAAADSWNKFYGKTLGIQALDYGGDGSNPRTSGAASPSSLCSTGIVQGSKFTGNVVIYRRTKWPYPSQVNSTIALTSFCPTPVKGGLSNFYMAIMEVNYEGFFVEGRKNPDLQTIVLHEFGHLMGLGHSCEGSPKTGQPNCNEPDLPDDYRAAVLFPVFSFDEQFQGEQKRALTSNDQGRANCLYAPATNDAGH